MKVLAIDQSLSCSGVCIMDSDGSFTTVSLQPPKGVVGIPRLHWIRGKFTALLHEHLPVLVVMEGYAFGAKFAREILGELGGILKLAVNDYACADLLVVSPNELKKYATGKGNAKKQDVLLGIYKNWEVSFDDDNQADAFALAVLGLHSRNMLHSMFLKKTTQAQLASVAAVAKSSVELGKPPLPVRSRTRLNVGQK